MVPCFTGFGLGGQVADRLLPILGARFATSLSSEIETRFGGEQTKGTHLPPYSLRLTSHRTLHYLPCVLLGRSQLTPHPGSAFVIGTETDKLARVCWSCVSAYFEKPAADALGLYTATRAGALHHRDAVLLRVAALPAAPSFAIVPLRLLSLAHSPSALLAILSHNQKSSAPIKTIGIPLVGSAEQSGLDLTQEAQQIVAAVRSVLGLRKPKPTGSADVHRRLKELFEKVRSLLLAPAASASR